MTARPAIWWAVAAVAGCAPRPLPPTATAATGSPAATAASDATPARRPPEAILADAVAATGGAAAWSAHRTAHVKLTVTFAGMAMGGPAERFETSANKSLTVTTLPAVGTIREGTNGKVFWSQDPVNGLRFLDGAEAEQARLESAWNSDLDAKTLFAKIETAADPPAGAECLILTPRAGPPIRNCYDRRTHLQVTQEGIRATPQGDVPFHSLIKDWRNVGGVKMAFDSETQAGPITLVTTITDVVFDEPMAETIFDPPSLPTGAASSPAARR